MGAGKFTVAGSVEVNCKLVEAMGDHSSGISRVPTDGWCGMMEMDPYQGLPNLPRGCRVTKEPYPQI